MASKSALALTVALHASIMVLALGALPNCAGAGGDEGGGDPLPEHLRGVDPQPLQVRLLKEGQTFDAPPPSDAVEPQCEDGSYVGIGVFHMDGHIQMVGDNTPASRAGLRIGDVIVNAHILSPGRYQAGTVIALRVRRDDDERFVDLRVGKVCY